MKVGAPSRPGVPRKELPMDTQTVIALCDLMLVFIGIIGLFLVRKE